MVSAIPERGQNQAMTARAATRVLIVAPWAHRLGGAEEMLWSLLNFVDHDQIDIARVVFLEHGPLAADLAALGFATSSLPATRLRRPRTTVATVRALTRILRRERPDVVLSWMAKAHLYAAPAALVAGLGKNCMWWQHMVPDGHWVDRLATALPTRAIGTSSKASEDAQRKLRPRRRTFVVHPGIDFQRYASDVTARRTLRDAIGLNAETFTAVIIARLQPWKGQHHVIAATASLRADGIDAAAIVVGGEAFGRSDGYAAQLRRQVDGLGITDHVYFTGHVEDPIPFMHAADALVNASQSEPLGISILEGMAAGLPVIAVDSGGPREIIRHGTTGLLIAGPEERELANALRTLATDRALCQRLGAGAQAAAAEQFGIARTACAFAANVQALA
jgi:glycosyltransferase involved in cell wall biosynthesis